MLSRRNCTRDRERIGEVPEAGAAGGCIAGTRRRLDVSVPQYCERLASPMPRRSPRCRRRRRKLRRSHRFRLPHPASLGRSSVRRLRDRSPVRRRLRLRRTRHRGASRGRPTRERRLQQKHIFLLLIYLFTFLRGAKPSLQDLYSQVGKCPHILIKCRHFFCNFRVLKHWNFIA